jgi:predicted GNAT family N-acyltransferase
MAHSVIALEIAHDVNEFDCGIPALNIWLKETAKQHKKKFLSQTFVLVDEAVPSTVIAFYALAVRSLTEVEYLPEKLAKKLPRQVPGLTLARLAVAHSEKKQGHGETMLINAIMRSRDVAANVGGYALFVDAKDQEAADFYKKYGFTPLPPDPLTLFMPFADMPL